VNYNADVARDALKAGVSPSSGGGPSASPAAGLTGDFEPGPNRLEIRYRNHEGNEHTYVGDRTTVRRKNNHLVVCLAPTGQSCSFCRDHIQNLAEVEGCLT